MPLTKEAQAVVDAFGTQPGVTAQQLQNLKNTIDGSPALTQEVNDAVAQGHLQRIVPLTNPHAGGEYSPTAKEMRLPPAMYNPENALGQAENIFPGRVHQNLIAVPVESGTVFEQLMEV